MARNRGDGPITLSLLDRLTDENPKQTEEPPLTRSQSLRLMKAGVRRDLEWLLNTRQPVETAAEGSFLERSLYMYGLPELPSLSASSLTDKQRLMHAIERTIEHFEPRLTNVRVTLVSDPSDEKFQAVRFVIEALLKVDPAPERVSFDTVLDLSNQEYKVQGEAGAR